MNNWANELTRQFSKRKLQMANKRFNVLNIFSHPGKTRAAQRLSISPVSLLPSRKTTANVAGDMGREECPPCLLGVWGKKNFPGVCWGCGGKKNIPGVCWHCELVQALWESVGSFLLKLNMGLLYDPAFPILGVVL